MYQFVVVVALLSFFSAGGFYLYKDVNLSNGLHESWNELFGKSDSPEVLALVGVYRDKDDSPDVKTLNLYADGKARLEFSYSGGAEVLYESGSWKVNKDGRVEIFINKRSDKTIYTSSIIMNVSQDKNMLTPHVYDAGTYGEESAFIFYRNSI